ncbi:ABC transporter substrate-binding protein [Massilia endophytica]|uniref:ABC transporter substrate-binding protein n=1 Tax=Massilia endophytica TaxID=2899220 RepID=UPI001E63EEED|nr:ABC transporter substrate-binding protein [Massilia endophytica]UGQ44848.1 ABC transporter substrate-binding protein [Massilia endophytica]
MRGRLLRAALLGLACAAPLPALPSTESHDASLQVLHWWTSAGERRAAKILATRLGEEGIEWKDNAVPGGAGLGAGKVLKSRVLAGDSPGATQIIGVSVGEWAELGLLRGFDSVAAAGNWNRVLFPTVYSLVQHHGHVVAAPLGIHRINTLFYNRKLFTRLQLSPPSNWAEFEQVSRKLRAAGVAPLMQSSEPWQVATLFENLVLAESGPEYYRDLFVRLSPQAASDKRLREALFRLRGMKGWMAPLEELSWPDAVRRFSRREAAMLVMGDWAKAELNEWGFATDDEFSCAPMPGTAKLHLYSVDTLAMLGTDSSRMAAQEKLAKLVVTPAVQQQFNAAKGAVSVRRDADPTGMDSCARDSWTTFAGGAAAQAPSLVHRMAADEESRDAIIAEVHRYFMNDSITEADVQRRLAAVLRALNLRRRK